MKPVVIFIAENYEKFLEVENLLRSNVHLFPNFYKIHEYQGCLEYVVEQKCKEAIAAKGTPVLVEENGLYCNALGGLPGTLTLDVYKKIGADGINKLLHAWEDKSATIKCAIGFMENKDSKMVLFQNQECGNIVPSAGSWESCFQPDGSTRKLTYRNKVLDDVKHFFEFTYNK